MTNGHRARVEVRITQSSRQLVSDLYHAWNALKSITQTAGDLEATHVHARTAQESVVTNAAWLELEQEAQARGAARPTQSGSTSA